MDKIQLKTGEIGFKSQIEMISKSEIVEIGTTRAHPSVKLMNPSSAYSHHLHYIGWMEVT